MVLKSKVLSTIVPMVYADTLVHTQLAAVTVCWPGCSLQADNYLVASLYILYRRYLTATVTIPKVLGFPSKLEWPKNACSPRLCNGYTELGHGGVAV